MTTWHWLTAFFLFLPIFARAQSLDATRIDLIVQAFNSRPDLMVQSLQNEQVHLQGGEGRVDVDAESKFSYLVQILDPANPASEILLLPLATSRFAPTFYQTDDWWDAHKTEMDDARRTGRPLPRQDPQEVDTWLKQHHLSTNPDVIIVKPATHETQRLQLRDFLSQQIQDLNSENDMVVLYRGGEKAGELEALENGQQPHGMRYWTPTANYAWRYARKNASFLSDLIKGQPPLFVFRVPRMVFLQLTGGRYPDLTLGAELTKNAHQSFDQSGVFRDHLYNSDYLGTGILGAEIELRGNRRGSAQMTQYFSHAITIEELAQDRVEVLQRSQERLTHQFLDRAEQIQAENRNRISRIQAEKDLMIALREHAPAAEIQARLNALQALPPGPAELALSDFESLSRLATDELAHRPSPTATEISVPVCRDILTLPLGAP